MIDVDSLSVTLGGVDVLDSLDLRVERGEFLGLVGPNGAGKTTLVEAINGVQAPDRGTVRLDGDPIEGLSSRAVSRRVATVPQDTHVGFSFRAEQIVEMGRTPHRSRLDWSDQEDPVERALERTQTATLRDRTVDGLSGGERQRVLLARALAQETPALLLDEPTASLDINHQLRVLGLVGESVADGKAAVAAIHDLDLAARFCDRLALLSEGRIRVSGKPAAVLDDPAVETAFDAETVVTRDSATGAPSVSALEGRPDLDRRVHVAGGGEPAAAAVRSAWAAGATPSVGPAPEGGVAARLAEALGIEVVTAPPFEPVSERAVAEAVEAAEAAEAVLAPGGPGCAPVVERLENARVERTVESTVEGRAD
ncbi:ABC transporter [Halobacteriales archaeon QH_10_67_13]|nr:MAG: ABC transporter [Halobacteriales archaeon QH_10_67_13]